MGELLGRIGWSKTHFADICGVDVRTVHEWCRCADSCLPTSCRVAMLYLRMVARILGV